MKMDVEILGDNKEWVVHIMYLGQISEIHQGPVVQSVISLTSLLVVKMLTVLVSMISNSPGTFAEKMWVAFANAKLLTFFQQKILAIFNDQSLNDMLTIDIVWFEQLGPDLSKISHENEILDQSRLTEPWTPSGIHPECIAFSIYKFSAQKKWSAKHDQ